MSLVSTVARPAETVARFLQPGRRIVVYGGGNEVAEVVRAAGYGASRFVVLTVARPSRTPTGFHEPSRVRSGHPGQEGERRRVPQLGEPQPPAARVTYASFPAGPEPRQRLPVVPDYQELATRSPSC